MILIPIGLLFDESHFKPRNEDALSSPISEDVKNPFLATYGLML